MTTLSEIINKEKILFIKCFDYEITIEWISHELGLDFDITMISEKTLLLREIERLATMDSKKKICVITTEMLNNFSSNELITLYTAKKCTRNFFWIDIGDELDNKKIEKMVKVLNFLKKEKEIYMQKLKKTYGDKYKEIFPFIKNMTTKDIQSFIEQCNTTTDLLFLKAEILSENMNIEKVKETVKVENVGGCYSYKKWVEKISTVRKKYKNKTIPFLPKGAVLLGWTGTGKSYLAKMTATVMNLPLFKFDLGMVLNKYIGESEKRMKDFLSKIEVLAPCIIWLDEMDKFFVNWEKEDTGVIARLLAEFLYFLQETKSDIFFLATINNFEQLPVELIRKGRFATMWYVNLPDKKTRAEIFKIYLNNTFCEKMSEEQILSIANITEGFTPAEICSYIDELKLDALYSEQKITYDKIVKHFQTASKSIDLQKNKYNKFIEFIEKQKIIKV